MYKGNEAFTLNNKAIGIQTLDFWSWAYSDMRHPMNRAVLAEYIVHSAIASVDCYRQNFRPFDLLTDNGWRIEVKSAAYVNSQNPNHPDRISFRIAPARMPDASGDYKDDAPRQRNCDAYVFCVFKGMSANDSPLNLNLWEFYVLATSVINHARPTQKNITLPSLKSIGAKPCGYCELKANIFKVLK